MPLVATPKLPGRREQNSGVRRERILAIAEFMFLEHGYGAVSMSSIAREVGGSKGTLWRYYPDKEKLFSAVIDRAARSFQLEVAEQFNHHGPLDELLVSFCRTFLRRASQADAIRVRRLVLAEVGRFSELGPIYFGRVLLPTQQVIARYIQAAATDGIIDCADPMVAAQQLTSLCMAGHYMPRLLGMHDQLTSSQIEEDAASAATTFLRAYAVLPVSC